MNAERAYRLLLACYPWEHRRQYENEMLGVLLDDAGPGRGRPRVSDMVDLLRGAVRARFRYAVGNVMDAPWRDAAAAMGLLSALAMLTYTARPVLYEGAVVLRDKALPYDGFMGPLSWSSWPRAVAWLAVVVALAVGWRGLAAELAGAGTVLEVVRVVEEYRFSSSVFDTWPVVFAVLAVCALAASRSRSGAAVLGSGRVVLLAAAGVGVGVAPTVEFVVLWHSEPAWQNLLHAGWFLTAGVMPLEAVLICLGLALGLLAVAGAPAPLRRRLVALLAPVGVTLFLTRVGFPDPILFAPLQGGPAALPAAALLVLALAPPLTLLLAVAMVHRRERTLRLLALGRAADRRSSTEATPVE